MREARKHVLRALVVEWVHSDLALLVMVGGYLLVQFLPQKQCSCREIHLSNLFFHSLL